MMADTKDNTPQYKQCPTCESYYSDCGPHTEEKGCWICEPPEFKGYKKVEGEKELYSQIETKIGELVGESSMCWSETPKGVFDSTRASGIVDELFALHTRTKLLLEHETHVKNSFYKDLGVAYRERNDFQSKVAELEKERGIDPTNCPKCNNLTYSLSDGVCTACRIRGLKEEVADLQKELDRRDNA